MVYIDEHLKCSRVYIIFLDTDKNIIKYHEIGTL